MKRLWPRHVRSRMALWYVLVLGFLLLAYAAGTSTYLFHSLREALDDNLLEDAETVEGLLRVAPDNTVALASGHPEGHEPDAERFVEVWSTESTLLYRSPALRGQGLGGPPLPGQAEAAPRSVRKFDRSVLGSPKSGPCSPVCGEFPLDQLVNLTIIR